METALLLGSLLLQVRSIICDPTWSNKDLSWRPVFIFESVILLTMIDLLINQLINKAGVLQAINLNLNGIIFLNQNITKKLNFGLGVSNKESLFELLNCQL